MDAKVNRQVPLTDKDAFGHALQELLQRWGVRLYPDSTGEFILVEPVCIDYIDNFIDNRNKGDDQWTPK